MATKPIYRRNPTVSWRHNRGLKKADDITGQWVYEAMMVTDDDGNKVLPNPSNLDRRYDIEGDGQIG
jgi:hypothetical protein